MMQDDETIAKELVTSLRGSGVSVLMSTALKGRRLLGCGTAYCQLVRAQNREKRLLWAQEYLGGNFDDVIWTDEISVQMETHRRFCCHKNGQEPRYKPCPKHPVKVYVWAVISWNGATKACIFRVSWMQSCIVKYCRSTWYPSYKLCICVITASCRTMIRKTHHDEHKHSLVIGVSTGGAHHLSHQMQTLLRICGMS